MKNLVRLSCAVLALALPGQPGPVEPGGAIEGLMTDESGAILPGVSMTIRNEATGVVRATASDETGYYRAPLLPVGRYELTASLSGFATLKRPALSLGIGQTLTLPLTLKVAGAEETVTVNAEAPILEVSRTHQASNVGERAVANLPVNGRNFIDFVLTTPGVNRDTRGGDISFAGQRGTLNSLVIDGADDNNTFFGQTLGRTGSGRAPYQFSQDAVQEFQVNRNAYSAEYGRAGGAVINVVTKSGTNEYHGSAFEFFRDKSLNANSYARSWSRSGRSPFRIHQFGGSLNGPSSRTRPSSSCPRPRQRQTIPNPVTPSSRQPAPTPTRRRTGDRGSRPTTTTAPRPGRVLARWTGSSTRSTAWASATTAELHRPNGETSGSTSAEEHSGALVHTRTVNASWPRCSAQPCSTGSARTPRTRSPARPTPTTRDHRQPERPARADLGRNNFSPGRPRSSASRSRTPSPGCGSAQLQAGADYNHDNIFNFFPGFSAAPAFNSLASLNRGRPSAPGSSTSELAGVGTTGAETPGHHRVRLRPGRGRSSAM
jgi:hypothetical protein